MLIRLLKNWQNGDTDWPMGQLFDLDDENGQKMIGDGVAEAYEPKANDVIKVSPMEKDSGLNEEQVVDLVNDVLKKNSTFQHEQEETDQFAKTGGFKSMSHFAYEVYKSEVSGAMTDVMAKWNEYATSKASGLSEGVNPDGGFTVPVEFRNTLMQTALEASIILQRTTKIPMGTNSIEIPIIKSTSHATSVFGGIIVYRPAEAAAITASKPQFGRIRLTLHKLAALAYSTTELLEDSPISMEPLLGNLFGQALGFQIDEDIINGTGVGQSLGVMNAPCLVTVAKESGQAAKTIETQNILKMWSRMMSMYMRNAIWLANNDCFPQLASLSLAVGTGGSSVGLLQTVTNGVTGAPLQTLLGKPLALTEHCQTIGTPGDLICADFGQYLVGQKAGGGVSTATSIHLKFVEDEVAFRFTTRLDGQPWLPSAVTPKHGTNTLSAFVALAVRS
jgi:HK97 family phage major capsid protein